MTLDDCLAAFHERGRVFRFRWKHGQMFAWTWNGHAGLLEWSFNPLPAFVYGTPNRVGISHTVYRQFRAALRRDARASEPLLPTLDGLDAFLRGAGAKPGDDVTDLARFWFRWPCEEGCRDRADRGRAYELQLSSGIAEGIRRYAPAFSATTSA
jgi:hypothetical protein